MANECGQLDWLLQKLGGRMKIVIMALVLWLTSAPLASAHIDFNNPKEHFRWAYSLSTIPPGAQCFSDTLVLMELRIQATVDHWKYHNPGKPFHLSKSYVSYMCIIEEAQ